MTTVTNRNYNNHIRWSIFFFICSFAFVLQYAFQHLLLSDELYFNSLQTQLSYERIEEIISQGKEWGWVGYAIVPVIFLIKFSLVSLCLGLGYYLTDDRFTFRPFFSAAIQAELVFLLPILLKMLWFLFVKTDYDLNDLGQFYPLSAANLVNLSKLSPYLLFPLQTLNLFEVAYWLLLAYGITQETDLKFGRALGLVASSYGVGLLLWVVLVMFLLVSYS